jgi:hypothetical protein
MPIQARASDQYAATGRSDIDRIVAIAARNFSRASARWSGLSRGW